MGHFPTLEDHRDLHLVLVLEKLFGPFHFEVDIMGIRLGPQADFLELDVMSTLC